MRSSKLAFDTRLESHSSPAIHPKASFKTASKTRQHYGDEYFINAFTEHLEAIVEVVCEYERGELTQFDVDDPIVKTLRMHKPIPQRVATD
jgi:hypothetical protein